jgi:PTS system mannose-specific IIA component
VIALLLISHGKLAEGMLDAMQMIAGEQPAVRAIGLLETEDVDGLMEKIKQAVNDLDEGDGVLLMVDLFGASPFNASARLVLGHPEQPLEVITGMNLPMLVELAVQREGLTLAQAAALAQQVGPEGIRRLSETMGLEH